MLAFTRIYEIDASTRSEGPEVSVLPKSLRGSHPHFKASGFPKSNLTTSFLSYVSPVIDDYTWLST